MFINNFFFFFFSFFFFQMVIINPRIKVMEKMMASKFIDIIGKEFVFLCIDDAIESCRFSLLKSKHTDDSPPDSIVV
jgi:hypothetical protein